MSETEHTKQKLNDRLLHVRLEGVGPITRSTMDPGRVDPEWEALSDLVYWCWCCRFQAARLQTSLLNEFTYWRKVRHVLAERAFAATSYDEHCLLVAATNLDRALGHSKALIGESPIPETTRRSLRLLRNLYEHWDEQRHSFRQGGPEKRRAAKALSEEFPNSKPWTLKLFPDGKVVLAGAISLDEFMNGLRRLEASARWRQRALRRKGRHVALPQPANHSPHQTSPPRTGGFGDRSMDC